MGIIIILGFNTVYIHQHVSTKGLFPSNTLTLYQPMTANTAMVFHKPIRLYLGGLIPVANTVYMLFCFFSP